MFEKTGLGESRIRHPIIRQNENPRPNVLALGLKEHSPRVRPQQVQLKPHGASVQVLASPEGTPLQGFCVLRFLIAWIMQVLI